MKVVIAMDSFKGSLTSIEAANAVKEGIKRVYADAEVVISPLADGGEGTVNALTIGMNGRKQKVIVSNPLGEKMEAEYGIVEAAETKAKKTAIIEMSAAAGITLIKPEFRNPWNTTTYGVGEIICDAIKKGCRHFIIGIGGSATNDGGIGMLQALGYEMLDKSGKSVPYGAKGVEQLAIIKKDNIIKELRECTFRIACDVKNPLCGKNGCSEIFGPQKGADAEMVKKMDQALQKFANLTKSVKCDVNNISEKKSIQDRKTDETIAGTGAAGGLGYAFLAYTKAKLEPGIQIVIDETNLEKQIKTADIVITGEGRLDGQSVMGKAPIGVAALAKKYNKKVIAFSGSVAKDAVLCNQYGIDAFFSILRESVSLEKAMDYEYTKENLRMTSEQVFRLL